MQTLLPERNYLALEGSRPTFWCAGEDKPFTEMFQAYAMWFNHVIRIQDDTLINAEHLWSFIMRGAMIICAHNQAGVLTLSYLFVSRQKGFRARRCPRYLSRSRTRADMGTKSTPSCLTTYAHSKWSCSIKAPPRGPSFG